MDNITRAQFASTIIAEPGKFLNRCKINKLLGVTSYSEKNWSVASKEPFEAAYPGHHFVLLQADESHTDRKISLRLSLAPDIQLCVTSPSII